MKVTDEMVTAAREVYLSAEVGAMMNDMIRHMISVAISAAPPSDDYRRGMEDAAKAAHAYLINENDELAATAITVIRALGEKK